MLQCELRDSGYLPFSEVTAEFTETLRLRGPMCSRLRESKWKRSVPLVDYEFACIFCIEICVGASVNVNAEVPVSGRVSAHPVHTTDLAETPDLLAPGPACRKPLERKPFRGMAGTVKAECRGPQSYPERFPF